MRLGKTGKVGCRISERRKKEDSGSKRIARRTGEFVGKRGEMR